MEEPEIKRAAGFLVERRGTADAKQWAAQQALAAPHAEDRAQWLRILQAIIDCSPSPGAETAFN